VDCPTHEIHTIKCPMKINDFTVKYTYKELNYMLKIGERKRVPYNWKFFISGFLISRVKNSITKVVTGPHSILAVWSVTVNTEVENAFKCHVIA